MSFIESPRFPENISYSSSGGPNYSTSIYESKSGHESRNSNWTYPLHRYDVAKGLDTLERLETLLAFFHVTKGRFHGFRYKDWLDYKSCARADTVSSADQLIGTGDGIMKTFQLKKSYYAGSFYYYERKITKPVDGTVVARIDGTETTDFSVDTTTGLITFDEAPADGAIVRAGYEFDVPCRFDVDLLQISIDFPEAGSTQIPVVEIRL